VTTIWYGLVALWFAGIVYVGGSALLTAVEQHMLEVLR
jgi:hypothetical protein